jgi:capsule polysaccharide export protein KpsE/RkpR
MDPRDDTNDDDFGPDESADAEPIIRELRFEMVRLQAQIDQIAAAAHDRAGEIAILRARLAELEARLSTIQAKHRRNLRVWVLIAALYGSALGLVMSYLLRP